MIGAVRGIVRQTDATFEQAIAMASAVPARFLGLDRRLGSIRPGMRANLVAIDGECEVVSTWIDGIE